MIKQSGEVKKKLGVIGLKSLNIIVEGMTNSYFGKRDKIRTTVYQCTGCHDVKH